MQYYTLKILDLRKETVDAVTVIFKQPGLKKIKYSAGQYLTLIFRINGRRYIRPYSFSSAPFIDANLEVTVKRTPGGIVSNYIIDKLNVGDLVEVMEPMGDFTLSNDYVTPETHVFLWGAGSGITPLMSIAKYALYNKLAHHVTLVYGNRTSESVIFYDKIKSLKGHYKDTFTALHFHTLPAISADNPDVIQGRIDPDKVLSALKLEDDLNSSVHYVCGPVGLKESVKGALLKLGINRQRIFCEDFEIERDPKEFENIVTRSVSINKNGHKTAVEVIKGKSILEAGLDSLLELSYSCQTGNCTVCKATLIKGEIKMIGAQKIDNLKTGECLLCCSFPVDDNVEVGVE